MSSAKEGSFPRDDAQRASERRDVRISPIGLAGILQKPKNAYALVVFAHGSGSSRLSPRNTFVAHALNDRGIATLLFDLLTPAEEADRANVFDIPLLADRLVDAVHWIILSTGAVCLCGECPATMIRLATQHHCALRCFLALHASQRNHSVFDADQCADLQSAIHAVAELEEAGFILRGRRQITILDRQGLIKKSDPR